MFKKAKIKLQIIEEKTYRPASELRGILHLRALKDFSIKSLVVELFCNIHTTVTELIQTRHWNASRNAFEYRTRRITHREQHRVLDLRIDLMSQRKHSSIKAGEEEDLEFCFFFPEFVTCNSCKRTTNLPPVFNVANSDLSAHVEYGLYAKMVPDSHFRISSKDSRLIQFDARSDHPVTMFPPQAPLFLTKALLWKSKLKGRVDENFLELYLAYNLEKTTKKDSIPQNFIANPLLSSHRRTRVARLMFNENYKEETYKYLAKDVELKLFVGLITKFLNPSSSLADALRLKICCYVDNLKPDFLLLCNNSSHLGLFVITSCTISIDQVTYVRAQGRLGEIITSKSIYNKSFGYLHSFDVTNFLPNIDDPCLREWEVPSDLLFDDLKESIRSIPPTYASGCGSIEISHFLKLSLEISESLDDSPKKVDFQFEVVLT